ncbi:hypothetical protein [Bradyrhizobium sp. STM 3557]|uniref:hypothetical protein n=1 Tax=Bradyrhizobium sp. STM 3557 TaxID=578920 RepID=UPI00388F127A
MDLDRENGHSLEELFQNLAETAAWCGSRPRPWSPFATFRSADVAPEFACTSRKAWVQSVADQRRRRTFVGSKISFQKIYSFQGRLLALFPDDSLACGVAEAETEGFLTSDNVPPWDTWVAYLYEDSRTQYLVSWVPGSLVRMVDSGIRVIPEECAGWVDERCPQLAEALAARGVEFAKARR